MTMAREASDCAAVKKKLDTAKKLEVLLKTVDYGYIITFYGEGMTPVGARGLPQAPRRKLPAHADIRD